MPVKYMNVGTYIFIRENKEQLELLNKIMENYEPTEYDKKVMKEALKQKLAQFQVERAKKMSAISKKLENKRVQSHLYFCNFTKLWLKAHKKNIPSWVL